MDKALLKYCIARYGDTQATLADAMGLCLSRLNAKINGSSNAEFTQSEIAFISKRYDLTEKEIMEVFFSTKVS